MAHTSVGQLWAAVQRALGKRDWVLAVKRIRQPNKKLRFDVYVPEQHVKATVHYLLRKANRVGWRVKEHCPWYIRRQHQLALDNAALGGNVVVANMLHGNLGNAEGDAALVAPAPGQAAPDADSVGSVSSAGSSSNGGSSGGSVSSASVAAAQGGDNNARLRMATWNINGVCGKREELQVMAQNEKLDVLCLQEVRRPKHWWRLSIGRGWSCIEAPYKAGRPGQHGLAIGASPGVTLVDVGIEDPNLVAARVVRSGMEREMVVVNVYVPWQGRAAALQRISGHLQSIQGDFNHLPIVVMGDWNMSRGAVAQRLSSWDLPYSLASVSGSDRTFWGGRPSYTQWTCIDHAVVSDSARHLMRGARVRRAYTCSDHFPLAVSFVMNAPIPAAAAQPRRIKRTAVLERRDEIALHNRFAALAEEWGCDSDDEEGDEGSLPAQATPEQVANAAEDFTRETIAVLDDLDLRQDPEPPKPDTYLSRPARRAIVARQRAWVAWTRAGNVSEQRKEELHGAYVEARASAIALVRKSRTLSWAKRVTKGAAELKNANVGAWFWKWCKSLCAPRPAGRTTTPVRGDDGELILTPEGVMGAWVQHYSRLGEDITGHSCNPDYWTPIADEQGIPHKDLDQGTLESDITWPEVLHVLQTRLKGGTAPGEDGITPEVYRACIPVVAAGAAPPATPTSPMAKLLFRLIQAVFNAGHIPPAWRIAQIVSIPKKGDLTQRDNYRGISLINIVMKLTTSIVTNRVSNALHDAGLIRPEQAGFRSIEECAGQATAFWEIAMRRKQIGEPTFACFVDLRKAFDTVPHEALLLKLQRFGIRGRCLRFFQHLYRTSLGQVRLSTGVSDSFRLRRGVRQGCPASPLLFDVFVNDVLDQIPGVHVPKVPGRTCPGLMFADDIVILADSIPSLRASLAALASWLDRWEMRAAPHKCGIMGIGTDAQEAVRAAAQTAPFVLQQGNVPIVDSYTYLGFLVHYSLSLDMAVEARATIGNKAIMALRPFLRARTIPLGVRAHVMRTVLIPRMTYGGELLGMQNVRNRPLQHVVTHATKMILGVPIWDLSAAWRVLAYELSIPTVEDVASKARARAFVKYLYSHTWIGILRSRRPRGTMFSLKGQSWLTIAHTWMKKRIGNAVSYAPEPQPEDEPYPVWVKKHTARLVLNQESDLMVRRRERTFGRLQTSKSGRRYVQCGYHETRRYLSLSGFYPWARAGISWLAVARANAIQWARRYCKRFPQLPSTCPLCGEGVDGLDHLMLLCPRLAGARHKYLIRRDISHMEAQLDGCCPPNQDGHVGPDPAVSNLSSTAVVLLLGGHCSCPNKLRFSTWLGTHSLTARQLASNIAGTSDASRESAIGITPIPQPAIEMLPPFVRVALFLRVALPRRSAIVRRMLSNPNQSHLWQGGAVAP